MFSYEALVRGKNNEPASYVFSHISEDDLVAFDQQSRKIAIGFAEKLKIDCCINLNFLPCTLKSANSYVSEALIRNIQNHGPRQSIIKSVLQICIDLGIEVIAEGVETLDEYRWLRSHNINLFQGFLFAKPGFESLPAVFYPDLLE